MADAGACEVGATLPQLKQYAMINLLRICNFFKMCVEYKNSIWLEEQEAPVQKA
jgi:hypothetical protein